MYHATISTVYIRKSNCFGNLKCSRTKYNHENMNFTYFDFKLFINNRHYTSIFPTFNN